MCVSSSLSSTAADSSRTPCLREHAIAPGIALVRATGMCEDFRRHTHRSVLAGLVTQGRRIIDSPQGRLDLQRGDGFIIPSGLVHWCAMPESHSYRVASVAPARWHALVTMPVPTLLRKIAPASPAYSALRRLLACMRWNHELLAVDECLLALMLALCDTRSSHAGDPHGMKDDDAAERVETVRAWLEQHCSEPVQLQTLAALAGCSAGRITRQFTAMVGLPPYEYVVQLRLRRAAKALREETRSIAEIALDLGFADQSHLQRFFRRAYGVTPHVYRQHARIDHAAQSRLRPMPD